MTKLLLIGCGNLGQNIINGFYKKKNQILICDENKFVLEEISKKYNNFFEVSKNFFLLFSKLIIKYLIFKPVITLTNYPKIRDSITG